MLDVVREAGMTKSKLVDTWNAILQVNYWPIFSITTELIKPIPARDAPPLANDDHACIGACARVLTGGDSCRSPRLPYMLHEQFVSPE